MCPLFRSPSLFLSPRSFSQGGKDMGWTTALLRSTESTSNGLADYEFDDYEQLSALILGNT